MMSRKTKLLYAGISGILLAGVFIFGIYIGYRHQPSADRVLSVVNKDVPETIPADFEPFWKVWNTIDEKYPNAKNITSEERVYGAIQGLVSSLKDPYSVYMPPEAAKDFQEVISGSFQGVGMEVGMKDNILTVIAPLKNTPAEKAGIRAGDKILKIGDKVTTDMTVDAAVKLIRGEKGTSIKLTVIGKNDDKPREITVTRDVINIPTLNTTVRKDGIYVVSLYNFSASSASLMADALTQFKASGKNKLIIDLRNNPGGYLDAAVNMGSMFLPEGDVVVTEDFGANGSPKIYRSKGFNLVDPKKVKVVILVDGGSASASEILAGALREHGAAVLIGEKTYGKGSVQEVMDITDDTTLKLTIAKWLTPNGISISEHGLDPDIVVTPTLDDVKNGKDPAMDRAVEYFRNGK